MIETIIEVLEGITILSFTFGFLYIVFGRSFSPKRLRREKGDVLLHLKHLLCLKLSMSIIVKISGRS